MIKFLYVKLKWLSLNWACFNSLQLLFLKIIFEQHNKLFKYEYTVHTSSHLRA